MENIFIIHTNDRLSDAIRRDLMDHDYGDVLTIRDLNVYDFEETSLREIYDTNYGEVDYVYVAMDDATMTIYTLAHLMRIRRNGITPGNQAPKFPVIIVTDINGLYAGEMKIDEHINVMLDVNHTIKNINLHNHIYKVVLLSMPINYHTYTEKGPSDFILGDINNFHNKLSKKIKKFKNKYKFC